MAEVLSLTEQGYADALMLASAGYAPLTGFMNEAEYLSVLHSARLPDGQPWGLPVVLAVERVPQGEMLELHFEGRAVGEFHLTSSFPLRPDEEAAHVYGTSSPQHPSIAGLLQREKMALSGALVWYEALSDSPAQVRAELAAKGWQTVAGFQTRNALHLGHEKLLWHALGVTDGLLLHPLTGPTKAGDLGAAQRWQSYEVSVSHLPAGRVLLRPYHAAMRYAGPREALTHAVTRRNYGVTHFLIGRDHAGVGNFYAPDAAQKFLQSFGPDLGLELLPLPEVLFCPVCEAAVLRGECAHASQLQPISASAVRGLLQRGEQVPTSLMREDVAQIVSQSAMLVTELNPRKSHKEKS